MTPSDTNERIGNLFCSCSLCRMGTAAVSVAHDLACDRGGGIRRTVSHGRHYKLQLRMAWSCSGRWRAAAGAGSDLGYQPALARTGMVSRRELVAPVPRLRPGNRPEGALPTSPR